LDSSFLHFVGFSTSLLYTCMGIHTHTHTHTHNLSFDNLNSHIYLDDSFLAPKLQFHISKYPGAASKMDPSDACFLVLALYVSQLSVVVTRGQGANIPFKGMPPMT
jgi:hypothetical protein